jgi:hypothetical protein
VWIIIGVVSRNSKFIMLKNHSARICLKCRVSRPLEKARACSAPAWAQRGMAAKLSDPAAQLAGIWKFNARIGSPWPHNLGTANASIGLNLIAKANIQPALHPRLRAAADWNTGPARKNQTVNIDLSYNSSFVHPRCVHRTTTNPPPRHATNCQPEAKIRGGYS